MPSEQPREGQLMFMVMEVQMIVVMYRNGFLEGFFRIRKSQVT